MRAVKTLDEHKQSMDDTCRSPAKVAKIGRKIHGKEPLRGSAWRRQLKYLAQALLLVLGVLFVSGLGGFLMRLG